MRIFWLTTLITIIGEVANDYTRIFAIALFLTYVALCYVVMRGMPYLHGWVNCFQVSTPCLGLPV